MKIRNGVAAATRLLLMVCCVLCARMAAAQQPQEPVLALAVDPALVPVEALRAELERELGVRVVEATVAPGMPTISIVRLPSGLVEVSLRSSTVPRASRELALNAALEQERVETLSLIAANLVRNEAAALLPALAPAPPPAPEPPLPPPPPPPLPNPCDIRGQEAVFGIDLAPGVGASSSASGRAATRRLSLGLVGTMSSRLHGLELSFGVNIQKVSVCGVQISNGANISLGPVRGLQFANFNLAKGEFIGPQAGPVNFALGRFRGLQAGVLNFTSKELQGMQGGIVNYTGGMLRGFQGGAANFTGGDLHGVQGGVMNVAYGQTHGVQAGATNYAGGTHGLQAGIANLAIGPVEGAQIGALNLATGRMAGTQLGVANISAREADGMQIGVLNYAGRSKASIGILSIVRHGRTSIDMTGAVESGTLIAGVTHGGKYVHNTYGVGVRTGKEGQRLAVQLGIGVRALHLPRIHVDVEAITTNYVRNWDSGSNSQTTFVGGGRIPLTIMLFGGLGIMVAPSYQVMVTQDPEERTQSIFGDKTFHDGKTRVLGYPGLTLGLRYEFDHGV